MTVRGLSRALLSTQETCCLPPASFCVLYLQTFPLACVPIPRARPPFFLLGAAPVSKHGAAAKGDQTGRKKEGTEKSLLNGAIPGFPVPGRDRTGASLSCWSRSGK
jgi:hypothetical protein